MPSKIILLAAFNIHDQYKASEKHLLKIKHTDLSTVLAVTKISKGNSVPSQHQITATSPENSQAVSTVWRT